VTKAHERGDALHVADSARDSRSAGAILASRRASNDANPRLIASAVCMMW